MNIFERELAGETISPADPDFPPVLEVIHHAFKLTSKLNRLDYGDTKELVVQVVTMIAVAVALRFALFGCSGVAAHKGAYGALFKVRCMVSGTHGQSAPWCIK